MFATNYVTNSIASVASDGTATLWSTTGSALVNPLGIAFDTLSNLYVANVGQNSITKYAAGTHNGVILVQDATNLKSMYGFCISNTNDIYTFSNSNGIVSKVNSITGAVTPLVTMPFNAPSIIIDNLNNQLYMSANG
jgi:hypothetical protein